MLMKELLGWPPLSGGTMPDVGFPTHLDKVYVERVLASAGENLQFACKYKSEVVYFNLPMLSADHIAKVSVVLNGNIGKSLLEIADLEF